MGFCSHCVARTGRGTGGPRSQLLQASPRLQPTWLREQSTEGPDHPRGREAELLQKACPCAPGVTSLGAAPPRPGSPQAPRRSCSSSRKALCPQFQGNFASASIKGSERLSGRKARALGRCFLGGSLSGPRHTPRTPSISHEDRMRPPTAHAPRKAMGSWPQGQSHPHPLCSAHQQPDSQRPTGAPRSLALRPQGAQASGTQSNTR